ncbi:putative membrane protein [Escherichia coli 2726950]|nr:putative membrane protein [Escherichia coli 2722950]ENA53756.1 putative membrane protein [Escherichia coli 2726950]
MNHARVRQIWEVIVLVLKCALAIAAVMAIYCLAVVLMDRLSD